MRSGTNSLPWILLLALGAPLLPGCSDDREPTPAVLRVTPGQGAVVGGTPVEVRTAEFSVAYSPSSLPTVEFGGQPGTGVVALGPFTVGVNVPPAISPGPVNVVVTSLDGAETATLAGGLDYTTGPIVIYVSPDFGSGAGGELVTIGGDNFDPVGPVTVTFGSVDATGVIVQDRFSLTCLTPPQGCEGRPVTVWVTNPSLERGSLVDGFDYTGGGDPAILAVEDQVFALVNQERIAVGKPPLIHDEEIRCVARAHSEDMRDRDFFDHQNPDGDLPWDRLNAAGIFWTAMAENIAWNQNAPDPGQMAVSQWLGSPPHKESMLDESNIGYTLTGLGVSRNATGRWWFTQVFVRQ